MAYGLTPTLYTAEGIEQFAHAARRRGQTTPVHVKVDTGMHRVGAAPADVPALLRAIADDPLLRFEGLWTHFPVADGDSDEDRAFTLGQLAQLRSAWWTSCARAGAHPDVVHAANTAGAIALPGGTLRHGPLRHRPVRLPSRAGGAGGVRRGVGGRDAAPGHVAAGPRRLGAHAGGGRTPLLRPPAGAATALGGGHGAARLRRRRAAGALRGRLQRAHRREAPAVGRHGDHGPDHGRLRRGLLGAPGDEVVLLGRQGDEEITADEWAGLLGTISYEILCGIGPRVPRIVVNAAGTTGRIHRRRRD